MFALGNEYKSDSIDLNIRQGRVVCRLTVCIEVSVYGYVVSLVFSFKSISSLYGMLKFIKGNDIILEILLDTVVRTRFLFCAHTKT